MTFSDILIQNNPTLAAILYPMLIGLIIGATVVLFNKQVIGKLVKKLLDDKIHSEGSAKTLDELGFGKSRMLKFLLRDGTTCTLSRDSGCRSTEPTFRRSRLIRRK